MKVFGLWYGGSSYAAPTVKRDTEDFDSIKEARESFESRYDGEPGYPAVSDESEMQLFFYDPRKSDDPYPDKILRFGPRGGVRTERA